MKKILSKILFTVLTLTIIISVFPSCAKDDSSDGKLTVAVSVVPEKAFVKAVCGDLVDVVTMIPPGKSPENYEPSPKLIASFSDAKVFFSMGVPAESAYILPIVSDKTTVVDLAKEVDGVYPPNMIGQGRDPHIWLSPKRAVIMVDKIAKTMMGLDPENSETYKKNAENYILQLTNLDKELSETFSKLENKKFIVYHPAFGYLASDYSLEMYALEEGGHEITGNRLSEMIELAKKEEIKVIFYQAEIASDQAKSFANEIGGKTTMLDPLSENYIENLRQMAKLMSENMK